MPSSSEDSPPPRQTATYRNGEDTRFSDDDDDVPLPEEMGVSSAVGIAAKADGKAQQSGNLSSPSPSPSTPGRPAVGEGGGSGPPPSLVVASTLLMKQQKEREAALALAASGGASTSEGAGNALHVLEENAEGKLFASSFSSQSPDVVLSAGSPAVFGMQQHSGVGVDGGGSADSSGEKGVWVRFRHEDHDALQRMQRDLVSERTQRQELERRLAKAEADVFRWRRRTERAMAIVRVARSDADLPTVGRVLELEEELRGVSRANEQLAAEAASKDEAVERARRAELSAQQLVSETLNEKLKQDIEMEVWRRKINALQQHIDGQRETISESRAEVTRLSTELQAKNDQNYKMGVKLLELKSKVSNVELQLRKIAVRKINRLMPNSPAELTITKNPASRALGIDVCEKGIKHSGHTLKSIQMVAACPNRFSIGYGDGSYDTFEHDTAAAEIVHDILEMLDQNAD